MRYRTLAIGLWAVSAWGQAPPAVIWDVRVENRVVYVADTADVSKFATDQNSTTPIPLRTFTNFINIGDIVSINGRPVKGTWTVRGTQLNLSTNPAAGQAMADTARANQVDQVFEILQPDGRPVGTLFTLGISAGAPPPGAPLIANNTNQAIVGGTGAYLGARGQQELVELIRTEHLASVAEDPSNRRIHGGGAGIRRLVIHLIPMNWPEIVTESAGPAIFHSDFSPVTAFNPARAGETLILMMRNLGPTRPGIDPGQSFPMDRYLEVNSPIEALVNGRRADVVNHIGWPGRVNLYRVDVRLPEETVPGLASIQVSSAFIPGPEAQIPVR